MRSRLRLAVIAVATIPVFGLILAALAPTGWFPGQLAGHWAGHFAVLSLPFWCIMGRHPAVGATMLAIAGLALWPHLRAAHADTAPAPVSGGGTAITANLLYFQNDHRQAIADLTALDPDLLALIETQASDRELLRHDARWPHQAWQSPHRVGGIGLLSRWPMRSTAIDLDAATGFDVRITTPDGTLRVIVLHTWSPRDDRRARINQRQLEELAGLAATEPGPLLVMGDLNASPTTAGLQALRDAGLQRPAGGEVRSWPSWLGPAGIAIDHVLGRNLALGGAQPIDLAGSDHHGILVRFALLR
jgi:endonuclease/exonuclease/phosphatase (EEP) superfamily protein YafD